MFYVWNNPLLLCVMWTLITGLVSQLTSDLIQHSESQQTRAQTHCSAYTAAIFVKSAGQKDSKY